MLLVIAIGIGLIAVTVVIHALGSAGLIRFIAHRSTTPEGQIQSRVALPTIIGTTIALIILHVLEILLWALAYRALVPPPRMDSFEEAVYFSFITFTTVGYGDVTLGVDEWRLLSGLEALNGIVLVGWSTALLFLVVQRSWQAQDHGRHQP